MSTAYVVSINLVETVLNWSQIKVAAPTALVVLAPNIAASESAEHDAIIGCVFFRR